MSNGEREMELKEGKGIRISKRSLFASCGSNRPRCQSLTSTHAHHGCAVRTKDVNWPAYRGKGLLQCLASVPCRVRLACLRPDDAAPRPCSRVLTVVAIFFSSFGFFSLSKDHASRSRRDTLIPPPARGQPACVGADALLLTILANLVAHPVPVTVTPSTTRDGKSH